jgi:hypothetical protein
MMGAPDTITAPALARRLGVATSTVHRWRSCGLGIVRSDGIIDHVRLHSIAAPKRILIPPSHEERRHGVRVLGVQEFVEALRADPVHRPGLPADPTWLAPKLPPIPFPTESSEWAQW